MTSLITQVKSKLFIHSSKKSMHALDGAYASLLRGRSLDFEDLRPYEYGDQVRDIDWRATAKHNEPLVKRTKATRMHTVLFVVDTGRGMNALAEDERPKSELAVLVAGALGFLTVRHGDDFSVVHGDASGIRRIAPSGTEGGLEHALRRIRSAISGSAAPNDRDALLGYVARTIARRTILVIVTDEQPTTDETERILRRLKVQHDVLWVTLRDADPVLPRPSTGSGTQGGRSGSQGGRSGTQGGRSGTQGGRSATNGSLSLSKRARRDVDSRWRVPDFAHGDPEILAELAAQEAADTARRDDLLRRLEISHTEIEGQDSAVPALLRMLNRRSHARL
ncbi:DUF58 domain-containing protein [Microbacterium sp. KUDC0406]|uniref:DUF58 domain-containing protein n=1 Tax=Microbacterium sp. KUDC0406 TaxID=2909588 RepID=UPI001F4814DD|nr:DUF58 domain-containing protein [Microbacterium sp. KUDC0406]UJP09463.1 DUF58 domain-containing protein [Microbacterium sp. KUDC0406]